jgi:SET domain
MMHFLSSEPSRSRCNCVAKSWSNSMTLAVVPTRRIVVGVAMVYFSSTTIPVMPWVIMNQRILRSHAIRKQNYRRYHAISLEPYVARQYEAFLTIPSRLHMSHDREIDEATNEATTTSSIPVPSLTSEMLSLRFRDVFAHFRSLRQQRSNASNESSNAIIPDDSIIRMNLLRTRHVNLELDKCRVDVSTIPDAGYGVYATKTIQKKELITLYPGDAIIQWKHKDHIDPSTDGGIQIFFGTHIPESERMVAALDNKNDPSDAISNDATSRTFMYHLPTARSYEVRINDTISVIGDPNRHADPAYLGHMINDYCTIDCNGTENHDDKAASTTTHNQNDDETIRQYNIQSILKSNCKIQIGTDQCHVEIVATRDIASNKELFLSYGSNYWLSRRSTTGTTKVVEESTTSTSRKAGFGSNVVNGKVKPKRK